MLLIFQLILVLIGFIILLKIFQDINFGIWLLILFFPFTQLRLVDTPFGSLQPSQLLVLLVLVSLLFREAIKKEGVKIEPTPLNKAILVFILIVSLSLIQFFWLNYIGTPTTMPLTRAGRINPIIRGATTILNIIIGITTFYLIIIRLKTEQAVKNGIIFWLLSGLLASLIGIYAFFGNIARFLPPLPDFLVGGKAGVIPRELDLMNPVGSPLIPRVASVLQEPRHLAIFLAPLVYFLLILLKNKIFLVRPVAQLGMMSVITITFVLTLSRITLVLGITILILYLISLAPIKKSISVFGRGQAIGLILILLLPFLAAVNFSLSYFFGVNVIEFSLFQWSSIAGGERLTYFSDQLAAFKTAWLTFRDHPIFGGGIGSYYYYTKIYKIGSESSVVNNIYLEILAEMGLLGLGAFIFLIFSFFKSMAVSQPSKIDVASLNMISAFRGSFIIILVSYLFLSAFFYPFVWGIMGLAVAYKLYADKPGAGEKDANWI